MTDAQGKAARWLSPVLLAVSGLALGAFAKWLDIPTRNKIRFALGEVLSGTIFYALICLRTAVGAKTRFEAGVRVFALLCPMLLSYYLFSKFVAGYFNETAMKFWLAALIPATLLAAVARGCRESRKICLLAGVCSVPLFLFDLSIVGSGGPLAVEIVVYILLLRLIVRLYRDAPARGVKSGN